MAVVSPFPCTVIAVPPGSPGCLGDIKQARGTHPEQSPSPFSTKMLIGNVQSLPPVCVFQREFVYFGRNPLCGPAWLVEKNKSQETADTPVRGHGAFSQHQWGPGRTFCSFDLQSLSLLYGWGDCFTGIQCEFIPGWENNYRWKVWAQRKKENKEVSLLGSLCHLNRIFFKIIT